MNIHHHPREITRGVHHESHPVAGPAESVAGTREGHEMMPGEFVRRLPANIEDYINIYDII